MSKGLYIHIPFCKRRCAYCDFYSTTEGDTVRSSFVNALCEELRLRKDFAGTTQLSTIYFGGGTPSQLTVNEVAQILCAVRDNYTICGDAEITMEVNPDDVALEYIRAIKALGINRISMGVQTFSDRQLGFLNRRHTARQARDAVFAIREAGIENVSLDLIYGLPNQSLEEWESDVEEVLRLHPTHISAYALSYEEGTVLFEKLLRGEIRETDEELSLAMYQHLISRLEAAGFSHYEISNFALPGFHSRHNSSYWTGMPYLGVGPGAHSFDGGKLRRANLPDLQNYISAFSGMERTDAPHEVERLTAEDVCNEFLMLSLRTAAGISLFDFEKKFGVAHLERLMRLAHPFIEDKKMECVDDRLRLTHSGIFLSDAIIRELLFLAP